MIRRAKRESEPMPARWRALFVLVLLAAAAGVLLARAVYLQVVRQGLSREAGRCALHPRREALRQPRHDPRPQRRRAGGQHAGGHRVGEPGRARAVAGRLQAARQGTRPRSAVARAAHYQQPGPRVRLPRAAHAAGRCAARQGHGHPGRVPAPRVPALLPGRRSHGPPARLHQRRRRRPGRSRARLRPVAGRRARREASDPGPARSNHRGRRAHPRAAPRPGPLREHRPATAVSRLSRAQGGGAGKSGAVGRRRRARHRDRRSARDGQPAVHSIPTTASSTPPRATATAGPPTSSSPARASSPSSSRRRWKPVATTRTR